MNSYAEKISKNRNGSVAGGVTHVQRKGDSAFQLAGNHPEAIVQRKRQEIVHNSAQVMQMRAIREKVDASQQMKGQADMLRLANGSFQANTIQRYPEAMDDDSAKALGSLYSTAHSEKDDDDFTPKELAEIKSDVYMLTDLAPEGMSANCIGWAQNSDSIEPTGNIYTWENKLGFTPTAADAGDARIILWGKKGSDDENSWDVLHASVLLSHSEIVARSKEFGGFKKITPQALSDAGIEDPCWTSVGGFGYGAIVHPRNWFEGGDFGTALKGMK